MRVIPALPRMTPVVTLEEYANINTLTELIPTKEQVRYVNRTLVETVARVHKEAIPQHLRYISLPPWEYETLTNNKTTKLIKKPTNLLSEVTPF